MPPNGTTGKSSSTGARGPTGPQGQARSSPAGNAGGKAGSVSRVSNSTRSSTAATNNNPRGPTGPKGQARTSPAGSGGGGAGSIARSPGGARSSRNETTITKTAPKPTGPRGPTGPKGEPRTIGLSAPTGRRGPLGPKGEVRAPAKSLITGAGKRFGPMANNIIDQRKMQGPPEPPSIRQYIEDYINKEYQKERKALDTYASDVGGQLARTGAQYGVKKQSIIRDELNAEARRNRDARLRDRNLDRSMAPMANTVSSSISKSLPNTKLPSRINTLDKMQRTYSNIRTGISNALYGKPPTVNRANKTDRQKTPDMFKNGGLVSKKGRVAPKGMK